MDAQSQEGLARVFQRGEGYSEKIAIRIAEERCKIAGATEVEYRETVGYVEKTDIWEFIFRILLLKK